MGDNRNNMNATMEELLELATKFAEEFRAIPEAEFSAKPLPNKWSKKEVLGHLIDSGNNNLRRFICGQYESAPPKITYEQDFWVTANNYQKETQVTTIELWKMINFRIAAVLHSMPKENYSKSCDTGHAAVQLRSLEWLADDYVKHMKHHINQIVPNSFAITYP